jgi:membrane fusion protein (multidrug efflux system)
VATLGAGSYLESGARVAAVVSAARLEVVAEFAPEQALGRLHPGQPARLRFAGFPWSRYGVVHARVESVGREARDGRIQVELSVDDETPTEIPLQHGLACSVEVDIASVSPAELVLRSAGRTPAAERAALGPR